MSTTFVSCFMNLYDTPFENKDIEWRFGHFRKIASTGISLCIFCSPDTMEYTENFILEFPNVRVLRYLGIRDTWVYHTCSHIENIELPARRNEPKDTFEYIWFQHAKIEFMEEAIRANPFGSTHFAWIDFNIAYVFSDDLYVQEYLRILSRRTLADSFLAISGCWDKQSPDAQILDDICWRFCGGFFMGDAGSVLDFHAKYLEHFPVFMETHRKLVWEVNFWAWLEANVGWSPVWYKGDHNDSIVQITADVCSRCLLSDTTESREYYYPPVDTYRPSSASHAFYRGQHVLNTRYVNYWYLDSGHCVIEHPHNWIISKNFVCILDADGMTPVDFVEMNSNIGLKPHEACFFGLEDIRLYVLNDELRFICTNIDFSPVGSNRMIIGKYNADKATYSGCRILTPPNPNSWCEKNWIPLTKKEADGKESEWFIYKWWPFEIGSLNPMTDQLEIVESYRINSPLFMKVRGSTCFCETAEGLLGIVHFSEDKLPRHYYHIMVLLDKDTFRPLKYSEIFCFRKIGIEFCIGFWTDEGTGMHHFWISQMDREPLYLKMPVSAIPLCFDFDILL